MDIYQSTWTFIHIASLFADFNMAPSVYLLVYLLTTLFVASYCIPIKPQSPDQGATDECYGTECYYYDTDYPTDTTVNVNFPENLTDAVLSSLPVIEASQRETVDLLNGTLVFQENILASQNNAVVLQNTTLALQEKDSMVQDEALVLQNKSLTLQEKDSTVQDEALVLQNETLTLLKKNSQHLENMAASLDENLQNIDRQIANMTSTMNAVIGNVANLLQKQLHVLRLGMPPPRDCQDHAARDIDSSGPYVITPSDGLGSFEVYCDFSDNEGWTVFQRRFDRSVNFTRNWDDYERGFGDARGEYWLGLKNVRRLISDGTTWALRIDLESFEGGTAYAVYDTFAVSDAASNYTLSVGEYSGNSGDSLKYAGFGTGGIHNGMPFTTLDRDNDYSISNCANNCKGGWWYNNCFAANLNGEYLGPSGNEWKGVIWYTWKSKQSFKSTQMKMRRVVDSSSII